jgi:SH3-like domain-containing protein
VAALMRKLRRRWMLGFLEILAPMSMVQAWGVAQELGQWRHVCSADGEQAIEVSIDYIVSDRAGRLIIMLPADAEHQRVQVGVSEFAWSRWRGIKWCAGGDAWLCDEAIDGEVSSSIEAGESMEGDIAVRLRSGVLVKASFRAERDVRYLAACA